MSDRINAIFSSVYRRYDLMNHLFSLGVDRSWRRAAAVEAVRPGATMSVLDVATGTGDLAIAISRLAAKRRASVSITAMDFNKDMLGAAMAKASRLGISSIKFEEGDALSMKYESNSFDVLVSAFALRNFDDLAKFSSEALRVLKPGGRAVLVDMSLPDSRLGRYFFAGYSKLMKAAGSYVSKDAYSWLVYSISKFDKGKFMRILGDAGFEQLSIKSLRSGMAFMACGAKRS